LKPLLPAVFYRNLKSFLYIWLQNSKIMSKEQAQTIIELLSEISDKLSILSDKITNDGDHNTVVSKLDEVVTVLSRIENNTPN